MSTWDCLDAELADIARQAAHNRPKRPCIYCGRPTRAVSQICLAHDDLPEYENQPVLIEEGE